jgi:NADH dehydrogenase
VAPGLKTLEDALTMRRKILTAFEQAEKTTDPAERQALLTFLVVGAGPTGVELAGSIADLAQQVLKHEFRSIDPSEARIVIAEGTDRVLPVYSPNLSASAKQALESLHVKLYTNTFVTGVSPTEATLKTPEGEVTLPTHTILWGAGVMANKLGKLLAEPLGAETDRMGRVMVEADLSVPNHPQVYFAGDLAHFAHTPTQQPLPGVAPVAMQQGMHVAKVIKAKLAQQPSPTFTYWDKGSMAIIGNNKAVASMGKLELDGFLAWLMWLVIHVAFLVEFDNRVVVIFNWLTTYFWRKRTARLIVN